MLTNKSSTSRLLLVLAMLVFLAGCASAYHDYADCCIPYRYCAPRPLPCVPYDNCHCPTPGASDYYQQLGTPAGTKTDADVPIEAPK